MMKILIACEESQAVCKAFRECGHEAYSCDIIECSGGHPEWPVLWRNNGGDGMLNKSLFSSKKQDWCTPQDLFEELDSEFHFVLDAAADDDNHKCEKYYTEKTDGLSNSWDFGGTVFCNPPYGKEIRKWVKKAYEEWQKGVSSVLLLPARTDTCYFHDYIYHIAEIRFLRGRLKFTYSDGKIIGRAPFPSMLVIYK